MLLYGGRMEYKNTFKNPQWTLCNSKNYINIGRLWGEFEVVHQ